MISCFCGLNQHVDSAMIHANTNDSEYMLCDSCYLPMTNNGFPTFDYYFYIKQTFFLKLRIFLVIT